MNREDLELYVTGNFDGDVAALERAIADDPALAETVADEARFEMVLRDAAAAATFCVACEDVVRNERCDTCGAATRPGGYTIERVLVSNAHGRMYVAHDADGKQVALKELAFVHAPTASTLEAFEREAKFLRALAHPAIPRFVASFEEGRGVHARYYLAQELVSGKPLDKIEEHWYSETEIVEIARSVLDVLVYLQSLSPMVIHRDIKPANLVRRADGSIAVVDFGAAYVDGSTIGATTVGTFGYMPTEQLAGIVDATTDLYALGASLLYLLTRQEPWRLQLSNTTPNVSAPLRAYLDKLIAQDPRARFQSAAEARAALDSREALVVKKPAPPTWKRTALIAATALVVSGGVAVGYKMRSSRVEERPVPAQPAIATLRISLPDGVQGELYIDDTKIATVQNGAEVPVSAGQRRLKILGPDGARCEQDMKFSAGRVTTVECIMGANNVRTLPPAPRLQNTKLGTWTLKDSPIHDAMSLLADGCGFNIVIPDHVGGKLDAHLDKVPCNQALETLLQSQGLWYEYDVPANLVRVGPKRALEQERVEEAARGPDTHPRLPDGKELDFDFKEAPLRDVLAIFAVGGGNVNFVVPDHVGGKVTLRGKKVPWNHALEAVLASQGLWYRYAQEGKIIRVAPRRQLEQEE